VRSEARWKYCKRKPELLAGDQVQSGVGTHFYCRHVPGCLHSLTSQRTGLGLRTVTRDTIVPKIPVTEPASWQLEGKRRKEI
jgi:hypothetical protein